MDVPSGFTPPLAPQAHTDCNPELISDLTDTMPGPAEPMPSGISEKKISSLPMEEYFTGSVQRVFESSDEDQIVLISLQDGAVPSQQLDHETWGHMQIRAALQSKDVVPLKLEEGSHACTEFLRLYGGLVHDTRPTIACVSKGIALGAVSGYISAPQLLQMIDEARAGLQRSHAVQNPWGTEPVPNALDAQGKVDLAKQKAKELQAKAVEIHKAREKAEKQAVLESEKKRREDGRVQQEQRDIEQRQRAEDAVAKAKAERARKQRETKAAGDLVHQRIKQNRERRAREEAPQAAVPPTLSSASNIPDPDKEIKILFRLRTADGGQFDVDRHAKPDAKLSDLLLPAHQALSELAGSSMPEVWHLLTRFSTVRILQQHEYSHTLRQLGLSANSVVEIHPGKIPAGEDSVASQSNGSGKPRVCGDSGCILS